ncbi:MAG: hypothetical protein GKR88_11030 [Flavobacteriaceae bacterium]|nr:MAG: hypothetical protein GKR88_11030 [Flavobacteriaceae bacterium]
MNAILPVNFKYTYALLPDEKLELGLKYALNGANFNIRDRNLPDVDKINYSRAYFGVLANYQLTKILRLEAYDGLSTNQRYNFVGADDNVLEFDSEAAPFFNVGIVWVPPKGK